MMTKTKIALSIAIVFGTASAGMSATRHSANHHPATAGAQCWIDTARHMGGSGGNSNHIFGYVGSCSERGAVPMTANPSENMQQ